MRLRMLLIAVILPLSIALCFASMHAIQGTLDKMEKKCADVLVHVDEGDTEAAREALAQMARIWEDSQELLQSFAPHEDLHAVTIQYVEAASTLEADDLEDFSRTIALLKESLNHLRDHEALSLSNLL